MILLDTHVLIWWIDNPKKLSQRAKRLIEQEKSRKEDILVSSISIFEIYQLVKKEKLTLTTPVDIWVKKIESLSFKFVPVDNQIAVHSVTLVDFDHKDPADRMIVATALQFGAKLITSDQKILKYPQIQTVW